MCLANRHLRPLAFLFMVIASAAGAAESAPRPKEMPCLAPAPAPAASGPLVAADPVNPTAPLASPKAAPAFRSLFVLVLPWNADRHLIEARRRVQFALRLDEPKEPAFRVTLRF